MREHVVLGDATPKRKGPARGGASADIGRLLSIAVGYFLRLRAGELVVVTFVTVTLAGPA